MPNENNVIKALVKLAMCPGNRGACIYTDKCSHACHGDACADALRADYGDIFDGLHNVLEDGVAKPKKVHKSLEHVVTGILLEIGVPAHIKGYAFMREAIIITVKNPDIINAITKELYPTIASTFRTTPSRVERAIRHAIEVAWDRGDLETLQKYFGFTVSPNKGKPTNSEFVALIADKIRLDM